LHSNSIDIVDQKDSRVSSILESVQT